MTILREVAGELVGMFLADSRLTGAIVILVLVVAGLIRFMGLAPIAGGAILLIGCLAILIEAALRETHIRRRS